MKRPARGVMIAAPVIVGLSVCATAGLCQTHRISLALCDDEHRDTSQPRDLHRTRIATVTGGGRRIMPLVLRTAGAR